MADKPAADEALEEEAVAEEAVVDELVEDELVKIERAAKRFASPFSWWYARLCLTAVVVMNPPSRPVQSREQIMRRQHITHTWVWPETTLRSWPRASGSSFSRKAGFLMRLIFAQTPLFANNSWRDALLVGEFVP